MAKSILTAKVAIVQLGNIEFEGLLLENGEEAIAIPQLVVLKLVPPNRSRKQLESLLGVDLPSHQKARTKLNSKAVNYIDLNKFLTTALNCI